MQRLKWKSDDKFTKVHLTIPQCLQDDFGRFKTDQAIINLVKVKVEMEQGIQEMDVNQDNQNKLEEPSIEAQHVKTKNYL